MQMQDMEEQVGQRDKPRPTLPSVTPVAGETILTAVHLAGFGNPDANDRMKDQRQEDETPLDERQQLAGAMDHVDGPLECLRRVQQTGVGRQVNEHVETQRNDPQQRMNATDREFVAKEEAGF